MRVFAEFDLIYTGTYLALNSKKVIPSENSSNWANFGFCRLISTWIDMYVISMGL